MPEQLVLPDEQGTAAPAAPETDDKVTSGAPPQGAIADVPDGARPNRAQERIEELNARAKAGIEAAEFWRQRFEESQARPPQPPATPAPTVQAEPEPNADDFDDPKAYTKAYTDWARKETVKAVQQAAQAARDEAKAEAAKAISKAKEDDRLKTLRTQFEARQEQFAEKTADYRVAISNPALTFMNGEFLDALMGSEKGPELAYHIAKNSAVAARLAGQSIPQRLASLGRLEAELSKPAPPPKVTAAPAPPTPIGGGSGGDIDPSKLSIADWMAYRTKQIRERRQAK